MGIKYRWKNGTFNVRHLQAPPRHAVQAYAVHVHAHHVHAVHVHAVHVHVVHVHAVHVLATHAHFMDGLVMHADTVHSMLYIRINSDMPTVAIGPKLV
jgi:hypothetical protein